MSDPFASPKKSKNTEQDIRRLYKDWTDVIQCCHVQNQVSVGFLPEGTDLFRSRSSAVEFWPDPVAWFGIHSTCASGAYGSQIRHFKTRDNLMLIDMSDVKTVERLRGLIKNKCPNVLQLFDRSFQIISPKDAPKFVLRATEKFTDLESAVCLKEIFRGNKGINGWFHLRIRKNVDEPKSTFHPEIMLFDISNVAPQGKPELTADQDKNLGAKFYEEEQSKKTTLGKRGRQSEPTPNWGESLSPPRKAPPRIPPNQGTSEQRSRPSLPTGLPKPDLSGFDN